MSSVDVVIPCYNYARYLPQAVESVTSQRDVDARALIIDDASPDDTPRVGAELAARDPRVTYVRNEKNLGLIGTANKGLLEWASADYSVLMSADDALAPGALARAATVMDAHTDVHMLYGMAELFSDGPLPPAPDELEPTYRVVDGKRFIRYNFDECNPAPSPAAIVRTSQQKKLGGYNPALKHTSDMEMWMRFAAHGPIGVIKDVQAFYRVHGANMSDAFLAQALHDRQEIIDACAEIARRWAPDDAEISAWLLQLNARFADEAYWLAGKALEAGEPERMKERLAFAAAHHPSPWFSAPAWKFRLKRLLGPALTRAIRGGDDTSEDGPRNAILGTYQQRHGVVGWWPEEASAHEPAPAAEETQRQQPLRQ